MEKIIVTGGAGFIGSHIVDALVEEGYEVHVIDNLSAGKKENVNSKAILHVVDIRDKENLTPIFENAKYVFHEAALPRVQYSIENPIETNEINVTGLLNVLEASRLNKIERLIFASSSAVYGDQKTIPWVETMAESPLSPYGTQKHVGEIYCRLYAQIYDLETVCLRYFNVYGPHQDGENEYSSVIAKFLKLQKENKSITVTGDGNQTRDFVHVKDIVNANLLALRSEKVGNGEAMNLGSSVEVSINKLAELIGGDIEYIGSRLESKNSKSNIIKAKELLNWEPSVTIEEGIEELKN